jgi:hypothetical protein
MAKIITNKYEIFEISTVYYGISNLLKITYFIKNDQNLYQSLCEITPEFEFIHWNDKLNKFEVNSDTEKIKEKILNISELYTYMRDRKIDILFK